MAEVTLTTTPERCNRNCGSIAWVVAIVPVCLEYLANHHTFLVSHLELHDAQLGRPGKNIGSGRDAIHLRQGDFVMIPAAYSFDLSSTERCENKTYRRAIGSPPMEYLLAWRMALAKSLLGQAEHSVANVAERVGYSSANAFSVAFARQVGQPPARYARSHRAAPAQIAGDRVSLAAG